MLKTDLKLRLCKKLLGNRKPYDQIPDRMIPQMNFLTRVYTPPHFSSVNFTQEQSDSGQQKVLY